MLQITSLCSEHHLVLTTSLCCTVLNWVLSTVQLDLSAYAKELTALIADFIKNKDAAIRSQAQAAVELFAKRCSDSEAAELTFATLHNLVANKAEKVTQSECRIAVYNAIGSMADAPLPGAAKSEVSFSAIAKLLAIYSKETNESAMIAGVGAMRAFASSCGNKTHSPELVAAITSTLADAKATPALKAAMLHCLLESFQGDHAAAAAGVCPDVLKSFRGATGIASSAVRFLAATFLLRVSHADPNAPSGTGDAKFVTAVTDRPMAENFFGKFSCARPQMELIELSLQSPQIVGDDGANGTVLYDALMTLLTHESWKVRQHVRSRSKVFLRNVGTPAVRLHVIDSFCRLLDNRAIHMKEKGLSPQLRDSSVLADAFEAIAVIDGPNRSELASRTLLAGHHPILLRRDCWTKAVSQCGGHEKDSWCVNDAATELTDALWQGLEKDLASVCRAVHTLARSSDSNTVIDALSGRVLEALRDPALQSVTVHDVEILNTPDGMLCSENKNDEDDEIAALNPNSKDYEEKLWEIKIRRDLARKNGADKPKKKLSKQEMEKRKAKLAEEATIRRRVGELQVRAVGALRIAVELTRARGTFAALRIACTTPMLYALAATPMLATASLDALLDFGKSLDPRLRHLSESIVIVVLRSSEATFAVPPSWTQCDLHELTARTMRRLWAVTNDAGPLDIPSFGFCWALLQHILVRSSLPGAVMEDALIFLTSHPDLGASPLAPRRSIIRVLAHVATNYERLALQATTYLKTLVSSMLSEVEVTDGSDAGPAVGEAELSLLVEGAQSSSVDLRRAAVMCLEQIGHAEPYPVITSSMWLAKHDSDASIVETASAFWDGQGFEIQNVPDLYSVLMQPLRSYDQEVRAGGARAIQSAMEADPTQVDAVFERLLGAFESTLDAPEVVRDRLGNIVGPEHVDEWFFRCGIAQTWGTAASLWSAESIERLFNFLVEVALVRDHDGRSQEAVMSAGAALIDVIAKAGSCDGVLQIVNTALNEQQRVGHDTVRVSLVVLLGSVAKHLAQDDPQIPEVIEQLLSALSTPSQTVQEAVGECLSALIKAVKPRAPAILERLFDQLLEDPKFGVRRGAAYGIAGVVKGLGILALKQNGVTEKLKTAIENKKEARHREGALMAYELLCLRLGRLFEPYIINVLRDLLVCYGDNNKDVRTAAEETAQAIMSKLTNHGVKLVLPLLLEAIESNSWRTKLGSVELLGAMAYMAPKQLSACLPTIVPRIQEVLSDAHTKVQTAGRASLQKIGSVIKNPEIQNIVPSILAALDDPHAHSEKCLRLLLETAFIHVIDAPSLALVMPILQRSLNDRSSKLKKSAAQIIGNMYTLTDPKDLAPYLPALLPGVQEALLDPEPSVRGIASKALGSIVKGMGEETFPELMPKLFELLRSEGSSVDRSGAAQGLSEVLLALGNERLEAMLEDFIVGTQHPLSHVREGHLMLFVYLPVSFRDDFVGYVGQIIPCLLRGLSDVEDGVRSTAMRAAVGIITHFSSTSVELLLPELERGLVDESWRIRESSVKLLGELMFIISGVTGKQTTAGDEDQSFGTEESEHSIIKALGQGRRDRVLAGVFLARQDTSFQVRQAANHVWKVVVPHTVRTLREVLPSLISVLLSSLGDDVGERRLTAARTLSEVLRKLGERILPQIFPILEENASSPEAPTRHGVCVALSEVIQTCSVDQLEPYMEVLIALVKSSLIDPEEEVRAAASQVFAALHTIIGPTVVDDIVSPLLAEVKTNENALDGLRQMIGSKGSFILPLVVPQLLEPPFTAGNASVVASLAIVAGAALTKHLEQIVSTFMVAIQDEADEAQSAEIHRSLSALVLSLDQDGVDLLLSQLLDTVINGAISMRRTSASLLADMCRDLDESVDLEEHYEDLIDALLRAFRDDDPQVLHGAWGALNALLTTRIQDNKPKYMRHTVATLEQITVDGEVAGLSIPNGVQPLMALLVVDGLQSSAGLDDNTKLIVMRGLGYIVIGCSQESLQKAALKITGPIIRVASESSGALKAECLKVAYKLLCKIPLKLKTMLPQLQPTFLKALRDAVADVRTNAVRALGKIAPMQRRMDPVYTDLTSGLGTAEGTGKITFLKAIAAVSVEGGAAAGEPMRKNVVELVEALLADDDEDVREYAGIAIGCLSRHLSAEDLGRLVTKWTSGSGDWVLQHGYACAVRDVLCSADIANVPVDLVVASATKLLNSDNVTLQGGGAAIAAAIMAHPDLVKEAAPLEKLIASASGAATITKDWLRGLARAFSGVTLRQATLPDSFVEFAVGLLFITTKKRSGLVEVESAIGQLLRMGSTDGERARYTSQLSESEATAFEDFCTQRVSRHENALKATLW